MELKSALEEAIHTDTGESIALAERVSSAAKNLRHTMSYLKDLKKLKENISRYSSEVEFKPNFAHAHTLDKIKYALTDEITEKVVDLLIEATEEKVRERKAAYDAAKNQAFRSLQKITLKPDLNDDIPF